MTITLAASPETAAAAAARRSAFTAGLGRMQEFLASNPDVPLPNSGADVHFVRGATDEDDADEIRRIAGALGVQPHWVGGHFTAERTFGPGVTYRAIAIPRAARSETTAEAA